MTITVLKYIEVWHTNIQLSGAKLERQLGGGGRGGGREYIRVVPD